ncbi:hypothetical protein [Psychromonas aquimarina]|uniref:hypothetical protein n=1 Tax=Psychromonas aquimarina TaxID=444919 RepID=UPI00040D7176|nr:hypothetical protein [Psychromonas aquimarina]
MKTKTLIAAFIIALSLPAAAAARGHHGWHMNQQYHNGVMQGNVNCPRMSGNTQQTGQMQPGMCRQAGMQCPRLSAGSQPADQMQRNVNCPRQTADSQPAGRMQPGMGRKANMQRNINCPYAPQQQTGDAQ